MIGARQIGLMRHSAILVNAARGTVVDAEPLFDALAAGSIRGAAIDVWDGPFPESPHRLYETPHLVLSPDRAGRTLEADQAAGALVVKHVRNALG
jgi:phosphoglycerate dehydrogenase-like enzyme